MASAAREVFDELLVEVIVLGQQDTQPAPGCEQHKGEGAARRRRTRKGMDGLEAVGDYGGLGPPAAEPLLEDLAIGRVIVNHEDAQPLELDLLLHTRRVGLVALQSQSRREME